MDSSALRYSPLILSWMELTAPLVAVGLAARATTPQETATEEARRAAKRITTLWTSRSVNADLESTSHDRQSRTHSAMQANQLASVLAIACTAGTLFFAGMGITAKQDFFLLLGNVACFFGNAVFIAAVGTEHPTWQTLFVCLTLLSMYSIYRVFKKYQRNGCDDDEDEEGDAEEDEADAREAELEKMLREHAASSLTDAPAEAASSTVRQRKNASK